MLGLVYLMSLRRREENDDRSRLPGSEPIASLGLTTPPPAPGAAPPSEFVSLHLDDRND